MYQGFDFHENLTIVDFFRITCAFVSDKLFERYILAYNLK